MRLLVPALCALIVAAPVLAALPDATSVTPAAPTSVSAAPKMVCRSTLETGSLVKRRKTCLNKNQWKYVNDQHEAEARKIVQDNAGGMTSQ